MHEVALCRRYRQLSRVDDYGVRDNTRWLKEVNHFCDNVLHPALNIKHPKAPKSPKLPPRLLPSDQIVNELVTQAVERQASQFPIRFDQSMTPIDYEHFCAERLKRAGWDARVTQASGDQGADIIATRAGRTIVIQCKHHSSPVGNKAVQEVSAAVRHYHASGGMVVATNGFTRSAEALAETNGVLLLSHEDLTPNWRWVSPS
jgi:restriction system protein